MQISQIPYVKLLEVIFLMPLPLIQNIAEKCTGQENHRYKILKAKRQTVLPHSLGKSGSLASSAAFPEHT